MNTIRSNFYRYANQAGIQIVPQSNGTYNLFDMNAGCFTHLNISMDEAIRVVINTKHQIENRLATAA